MAQVSKDLEQEDIGQSRRSRLAGEYLKLKRAWNTSVGLDAYQAIETKRQGAIVTELAKLAVAKQQEMEHQRTEQLKTEMTQAAAPDTSFAAKLENARKLFGYEPKSPSVESKALDTPGAGDPTDFSDLFPKSER